MEIYLEPRSIDAISDHLETKQSCLGLVIGKPISDRQLVIQDLLPLNLRPAIFSNHALDKIVLKRQELEQFSENIEMLHPQGLTTIGIWTYSQAPQNEDLEIEYLRLCQLLFYVDEVKPPSHSFAILNFHYDQKAGFHITATHCPSYDLIEKAKLVIGGFPLAFGLRKIQTLLKFQYSLKSEGAQKVDAILKQIRDKIKLQIDQETLYFLDGRALTPQDQSTSLVQISQDIELKIEAFQREGAKSIAQIEEDSKLSLQWTGTYPVQLYIEGGANISQVRGEIIKCVLEQFDQGVECARESQGEPNAFKMDTGIIDRVDYFNLYIPRTIHFRVRETLYKDYLLPSEAEHSAKQRLSKLFGNNLVQIIETKKRGVKGQPEKKEEREEREEERERKGNCFQNKGVVMGVGLGLVCIVWGLLFI